MYFGTGPRIPSYLKLEAQTGDRVVGRVLRFDSFSKILSAGIRIGFVTGPAPLLDTMDRHVWIFDHFFVPSNGALDSCRRVRQTYRHLPSPRR